MTFEEFQASFGDRVIVASDPKKETAEHDCIESMDGRHFPAQYEDGTEYCAWCEADLDTVLSTSHEGYTDKW